ncbi:hypothetical protein LDENG_00219040 [Lucifuga dentata]|nr:hypothetical protein LDENG_00219040 [Lucifuga dentata]
MKHVHQIQGFFALDAPQSLNLQSEITGTMMLVINHPCQPRLSSSSSVYVPIKGAYQHHLPLLLDKMDQSELFISVRRSKVIMQRYEDFKHIITATSNTVAANKAREECCRKLLIVYV